jgi:hypothetical protein
MSSAIMLVILQEAQTRKISVWGQSPQKVLKTSSQLVAGLVACVLSSASEGNKNRRIMVQAGPCIKQDPIWKIINTKKAGGVAQVVQHLPSEYEALNSITSTKKNCVII